MTVKIIMVSSKVHVHTDGLNNDMIWLTRMVGELLKLWKKLIYMYSVCS
jgi:hypothetical protein